MSFWRCGSWMRGRNFVKVWRCKGWRWHKGHHWHDQHGTRVTWGW